MTYRAQRRQERRHPRPRRVDASPRNPARSDRDRILYSVEFQRLSGVTQVVSPTERFPVHNRLTHSIKVSQVGRSIAERLLRLGEASDLGSYLDADVVEAACLAHDLGHPPFGHTGERTLDDLLISPPDGEAPNRDGFDGNAQSFRIVTNLAVRYLARDNVPGLNLTRATLHAMLKYPNGQAASGKRTRKWGFFTTERADAEFALKLAPEGRSAERSLEADIMDCADDITFGVHDVEDFVRAGLLPIHLLRAGIDERARFVADLAEDPSNDLTADDVEVALESLEIASGRYDGRHASLARVSEFRSEIIDRLVTSLGIVTADGWPRLAIPEPTKRQIAVLRALTRYFVIDSAAVQRQRYGQRRLIRDLFDIYVTQAQVGGDQRKQALQVFPPYYQEQLADEDTSLGTVKRTVVDLIAGMSESQLVDNHAKLTGRTLGSVVDPVV